MLGKNKAEDRILRNTTSDRRANEQDLLMRLKRSVWKCGGK
jgi:hypothetical protein